MIITFSTTCIGFPWDTIATKMVFCLTFLLHNFLQISINIRNPLVNSIQNCLPLTWHNARKLENMPWSLYTTCIDHKSTTKPLLVACLLAHLVLPPKGNKIERLVLPPNGIKITSNVLQSCAARNVPIMCCHLIRSKSHPLCCHLLLNNNVVSHFSKICCPLLLNYRYSPISFVFRIEILVLQFVF